MKHSLHLLAAILGLNLALCLTGCSLFAPRLPDGSPATQPTTQPLTASPAQTAAVTMQTLAVATPPPWNAIIGGIGSLLGLAASIYAQTKQLKPATVSP